MASVSAVYERLLPQPANPRELAVRDILNLAGTGTLRGLKTKLEEALPLFSTRDKVTLLIAAREILLSPSHAPKKKLKVVNQLLAELEPDTVRLATKIKQFKSDELTLRDMNPSGWGWTAVKTIALISVVGLVGVHILSHKGFFRIITINLDNATTLTSGPCPAAPWIKWGGEKLGALLTSAGRLVTSYAISFKTDPTITQITNNGLARIQ